MMDAVIQLVMAFIGTGAFVMMCNMRRDRILIVSLSGMLCWAAYLAASRLWHGVFVPSLAASAFAATCSEMLARKFKAPVTIFLIPSIISLVPGGSLFYTMSLTVSRQWEASVRHGYLTIDCALGISVGVSLVTAVFAMMANVKRRHGQKRGGVM